MKTTFLFIFIQLLLFSCVSDLPKRSIDRKPKFNELIGKWQITTKSVEVVEKFKQKFPDWDVQFPFESFELLADSTVKIVFKVNSIFGMGQYDFFTNSNIVHGKWHLILKPLIYGDKDSCFQIEFELSLEDNNRKGKIISFLNLVVAEENEKLILWYYLGDPDQVIYVDYGQIN
jgi:hypothetical protein